MPLELVIAGRRPLPHGSRPWTFELDHIPDDDEDDDEDGAQDADADLLGEGALVAFEPPAEELAFQAEVAAAVGFTPTSVIVVRPASWRMSELAAALIARALEGAVYVRDPAGAPPRPLLDAHGHAAPAQTLDDLEERIERAYDDPRALHAVTPTARL